MGMSKITRAELDRLAAETILKQREELSVLRKRAGITDDSGRKRLRNTAEAEIAKAPAFAAAVEDRLTKALARTAATEALKDAIFADAPRGKINLGHGMTEDERRAHADGIAQYRENQKRTGFTIGGH